MNSHLKAILVTTFVGIPFVILMNIKASASWCDIKDKRSGTVLNTYEGQCNQRQFGGPWGDPVDTEHVPNTTKQDEIDANKRETEEKAAKKKDKKDKLKAACQGNVDPAIKAICDVLEDDP